MEIESIIKEFKETTISRKDFYVIVEEKDKLPTAFDVTAYNVGRTLRLDIREQKK